MNFFFIKNSLFPVLGHGPLPGPKLTLYVIICFWLRNFRGSQKEMVFHKKKKKNLWPQKIFTKTYIYLKWEFKYTTCLTLLNQFLGMTLYMIRELCKDFYILYYCKF